MKKIILLLGLAVVAFAVTVSCDKEKEQPGETAAETIANAEAGSEAEFIYILNEGVWGGNDASLDRITLATGEYESNVFGTKNGRDLGDVANDIQIYGGKMYVVVNNSNTLEVLNPATANSIAQISLADKQPRYVVGHEGFVYVSCYSDEIVKIDTATYSIIETCTVGRDPEMMAVVGQNLYVVNSGGLDNPNYDTTISIVDLDRFTETKKVAVGINPTKLIKIDDSRLLAVCNGDYDNVPSSLRLVDLSTENVTEIASPCTNLIMANGFAYCYDFDWFTHQAVFYRINLTTFAKEDFVLSGSGDIVSPYGIAINKGNGNIYVTDSRNFLSNGDIYCFSATGAFCYKCECGVGPSKVVMW